MSRLSRSFLGDAISTAAAPLLSPSDRFDCRSPARSPVTPRRPAFVSRDTDGGLLLSPPGAKHSAPVQARETARHYVRHLPSRTSLPRESTDSSTSGGSTSRSILRQTPPPEPLHPESLRFSYSSSPTENDHFLPLSAQAITPSILPQHQSEDGQAKFGPFTAINIILGKTIGVGVYSVSSSIYSDLGSVGMTITMWIIGSLISFCGLSVYLDLGSAMPRSGGERVYLERIFRRPRMLATCMFMAYVVLLGFSTPNCIVLGQYAIFALGFTPTTFNVRTLAVLVITCACILHARYPRLGLHTINILGVAKMLTLAFIVASGLAASFTQFSYLRSTAPNDSPLYMNFKPSSLFAGTSRSPYAHATALLKILYCFRGYNTANTVLGSLRRPIPTLKRSAPVALSLVSASYISTNLAYFAVIPAASLPKLDTLIAAHFLQQVFGSNVLGERILPWLIIVSAFGNVAATSFAQATVNQELARDGLLPFSSFFAAESPWNRSPASGLLLHWAVSVAVIVLPPPGPIYEFLVELGGYPVSVISVAVAAGLLYLQLTPSEKWRSPIPSPRMATGVFLASNLLLLVFPWVEPKGEAGSGGGHFVYYAYPACGVGVLALGAYYWVWWRYMRAKAGMGGGNVSFAGGGGGGRNFSSSSSSSLSVAGAVVGGFGMEDWPKMSTSTSTSMVTGQKQKQEQKQKQSETCTTAGVFLLDAACDHGHGHGHGARREPESESESGSEREG